MNEIKHFVLFSIIIMLFFLILIYGIIRADRICSQANPNDYAGYRFCMGI